MKEKTKVELLFKGFFETCSKVAKSMGAEGKLAVISNSNSMGLPTVTKDGVTISRNIFFKNKYKNLGAFFAKQASAQTLSKVGDATTTTLVFAKSIVKNTFKDGEYYFNSKVREGVEKGKEHFEEILKSLATPTEISHIYSIAKISANNSDDIAKIVTEAYNSADTIDVRENPDSYKTTVEVSQGMRLEKGWKSPHLINNQENATFEASKVNILVYEGNIGLDNAPEIANFINTKRSEPILIICERISDDVLANIEDNKKRGILNICVIEAPFYADQRQQILSDIAIYTNTEVHVQGISQGYKFGFADKVIVDYSSCSIIQDDVNENVLKQIAVLENQLENSEDKAFTENRIKILKGKAAIISVGEITDGARKEKFDRVEDSVCAVRSAIQEGIIAGGGSGLVYILGLMDKKFDDKDIQYGYDVLKNSLVAPYKTILENARIKYKKHLNHSKESYGVGYNVKTNKTEDLFKSGVIDSAKSLRIAMENAVSVSNLLLNAKVLISI